MLRVLSVAFPLAAVSPDTVGGAEQVLSFLDRSLVEAGHGSFVVACEGSQVEGTLVPVPVLKGPLGPEAWRQAHANHRQAIATALDRYSIDLVHLHGIDFSCYLPPPGAPALATLHLPPSWYPPEALMPERPRTWLHCVSASQQRACPHGRNLLPPIENGVPVDELSVVRHAKRDFSLALGRVCPEKGYHIALDAAHRAGRPLLIGGKVYEYDEHRRYFEREIVPRLDGRGRFLGPLGFTRKRRLLSAARCLVVPSLAQETSSLVAMEALACGTPVVALPNGALADIVEHGRTGFLVRDEREMADAIKAAGDLDPEACREVARRRFSLQQTAERYMDTYRWLAGQ
ncbi:glycosyltransferase family 4 protein [Microvirga roseola]|uniref:glycosyltransferase family 4 protein n=1 Tax=Microvirga roseola TaxID=2883126 RepID=UPI001E4164D2|nr:glycosyltransferase family 4 protein [Microvirga roseola]